MTEENSAKVDRRVIAREYRTELDEQVRDMETKGWTLDQDAEIEPFRPNPSSPPWPTVLMTRPVDHPNVLPELRQANHQLRNQVGDLILERQEILRIYHLVAAPLQDTFVDRGGFIRIRDEEAFSAAREAIDENRERYGPRRAK